MENFIHLLETVNQWFWFGFAVVLVILEMALGVNFFLLWLGICAAAIGVINILYPSLSWEYQFIIYAFASIACIVFWHLHLKHNPAISDEPLLNRRSEQYIGRVVTLEEPLVNGRGKIRIDDSFWRIEGPDLPVGALVKIVAVDGVVLKIEPN